MPNTLTHQRLKETLIYNPDTGEFIHLFRKKKAGTVKHGSTSGGGGYSRIMIDYKFYYTHRLAWFYIHGEWPKNQIDHINGNRSDNRISNLREATTAENRANRKTKPGRLLKGVSFKNDQKRKKKYGASLVKDGKRISLGVFMTEQEAHAAYCEASKKYHGEFSFLNSRSNNVSNG